MNDDKRMVAREIDYRATECDIGEGSLDTEIVAARLVFDLDPWLLFQSLHPFTMLEEEHVPNKRSLG